MDHPSSVHHTKKFQGSKKADYQFKIEMEKNFLGGGGVLRVHPRGIKKFQGSKKADYQFKIEIKKTFLVGEIRQKEIKLGPHWGTFNQFNGNWGKVAITM